jgi:RNA polymerase sigma-70 factor (ECF subfamily)
MDVTVLNELIRQAQRGQAEAVETLFERFQAKLYGYFLNATRDVHGAEDLLGEMALRLVKQLGRYDDRGQFEHWLFRIAANLVRDRRRKRMRWQELVRPAGEDTDGRALDQQYADTNALPIGHELDAAEDAAQLARAMEQLDDDTREMIQCRYFHAMTFRQMAKQFGCPVGTALAKVHRGLKALRQLLEATPQRLDAES